MIIEELKEKLTQDIYGLGKKKAADIAEYILFVSLSILRGRNKNPSIQNAGSVSTVYFQKTFNISRSLSANILDYCFNRGEEYCTGSCKPSIPKPWLKDMTLQYVSENHYQADELILHAGQFDIYPMSGSFYIDFHLPIDNLKAAIREAKYLMNADEYYTSGPDIGKLKNNQDEYNLAKIYLEAGLQRDGYFCEKYQYKKCGRIYQSKYGFQNMKKAIRNLAFKDYYNVDINSSFFRMAHDLYANEWSSELQTEIRALLDDKEQFYSDIQDPKDFKISLLAILLGSNDFTIINNSEKIRKLNRLLNEWKTPFKRRKELAEHLFKKEQEYVSDMIHQMQEIPHVLIHDGFIVKNNYQLDEKIWSIKQL